MKFFVLITFLLTGCLSGPSVYGCSKPGSLIGGFDDTTYVFLGKVKAYAEATIKPKRPIVLGNISGIEIEVVGKVHLPRESRSYTVVPLSTMADCSPGGFRTQELRARFPIGSQVRVIAREPEFIASGSNGAVLEAGYADHTSIASNSSEDPSLITTIDSVFDYGALVADSDYPRPGLYYLVAFEVQKDLVRLERAKTALEIGSILKRLEKAPAFARLDQGFLRREPMIRPL